MNILLSCWKSSWGWQSCLFLSLLPQFVHYFYLSFIPCVCLPLLIPFYLLRQFLFSKNVCSSFSSFLSYLRGCPCLPHSLTSPSFFLCLHSVCSDSRAVSPHVLSGGPVASEISRLSHVYLYRCAHCDVWPGVLGLGCFVMTKCVCVCFVFGCHMLEPHRILRLLGNQLRL